MQYLITDLRTNAQTWVSGETVRAALIAHENAWRTQKLPATTKVSSYGEGAVIDASLGESACRGRRENVQRAGGDLTAYYLPKAGGVLNVLHPDGYLGGDVAAFLSTLRDVYQWVGATFDGQIVYQNSAADDWAIVEFHENVA